MRAWQRRGWSLVGIAALVLALLGVAYAELWQARSGPKPNSTPGFFESVLAPAEPAPTAPPCPVVAIEKPRGWLTACDARLGVQYAHPRDAALAIRTVDATTAAAIQDCDLPVSAGGAVACLRLPSGAGAGAADGTLYFRPPLGAGDDYLEITARAVELPAIAATLAFFDPENPKVRTGLESWRTAIDIPAPNSLRCRTGSLRIEFVRKGQASNHTRLDYRLTNTGDTPCQLYGWPGLQMVGSDGSLLPTEGRRVATTYLSAGVVGPMRVTLAAGGSAYLEFDPATPVLPGPCITPSRVLVTPPDEYTSLQIAGATFGQACMNGQVSILPVFPIEI